ncbi:MAG: hypothetical protein D6806_03495 [Deltaproteobacteria bacterium]|nr:MAG: hypothetical protein D6806_03495 [Deltaproteobacteria bacterium]
MPWLSFAYVYAIGGVIFFLSIVMAVMQGRRDPAMRVPRRVMATIVAGFVVLGFGMHLALMLLAEFSG